MFYSVCRLLYCAKILYHEVAYLSIVRAIVMKVKFPLGDLISCNTKNTSCLDLLALDSNSKKKKKTEVLNSKKVPRRISNARAS